MNNKVRLGDLLIKEGLITQEQLNEALKRQKSSGKKLGEILIDEEFISENHMIKALEVQLGIPHMNLNKNFIDASVPRLISEKLAKRHMLIPVEKHGNILIVAMADPLNIFAMDDVRIATGHEIKPVIASRKNIINAIDYYYGRESAEKAVEDFKNQFNLEKYDHLEDEHISEINNAPVVRLINSIIKQAVKGKASDIHIEPYEKNVRVRFRVDGLLQEIMSIEKSTHSAIITRIKIMGNMNIAENRTPQDGRVEVHIDNKEVDLRISIIPTVYGEKIVMRLLDRSSFLIDKKQLGFIEKNLEILNNIMNNSNGVVLVTGPTGSGKTTTLYTLMREINTIEKNIITVEDPVEYRLAGINQIQVNNKANMTFSNSLRSILRQDPDIIMIGEIRDVETAKIAVRASITGHLVLSTMHTNDSPSTVLRLVDMGVQPYLVASAVVGVISQRLVRKICENCKVHHISTEEEMNLLSLKKPIKLFKGRGCSQCNNKGYKGRVPIHEIMPVTKSIREAINNKNSIDFLKDIAIKEGMITLQDNCKELVLGGITTISELIRVTYTLN